MLHSHYFNMFENWFKVDPKEDEFKKRPLGEQEKIDAEKENLQNIVDKTILDQQKFFEITNKKLEASQVPDDQELNTVAMAQLLNKDLEEAPLIAHETELQMKERSEHNAEDDKGYITKN